MQGQPGRPSGPLDPHPQRGAEAPNEQQVVDEICRELLAIHADSYGRPAGGAEAHVFDDAVIVLLHGLDLLPAELFLIEQGQGQAVNTLHSQFQLAIESTFRAAVERATGRRVIGFTSQVHFDEPRFMTEVFRLEPRAAPAS
jgi:uncharacterized protein YbcI